MEQIIDSIVYIPWYFGMVERGVTQKSKSCSGRGKELQGEKLSRS